MQMARATVKTFVPLCHWSDPEIRKLHQELNSDIRHDMTPERLKHCLLEMYAAMTDDIRAEIEEVKKLQHLPFVHVNLDLWTSQITSDKYIGVHIFYMNGASFRDKLLAVRKYDPPSDFLEHHRGADVLVVYLRQVCE